MEEIDIKKRIHATISDDLRNVLNEEIDNRIKQLGLQKKDFVKKIGITNSMLWNMLHRKGVDIGAIELIANALECDVEIKLIPRNQEGETL